MSLRTQGFLIVQPLKLFFIWDHPWQPFFPTGHSARNHRGHWFLPVQPKAQGLSSDSPPTFRRKIHTLFSISAFWVRFLLKKGLTIKKRKSWKITDIGHSPHFTGGKTMLQREAGLAEWQLWFPSGLVLLPQPHASESWPRLLPTPYPQFLQCLLVLSKICISSLGL